MLSSTLEFERVIFHSENPIKLDQEDRVMKCNKQSYEAQPNSTMVLCRPLMDGKAVWEIDKFSPFQQSRYLCFSAINASFIISYAPLIL
jgi:hypothetical protein